MTSAFHLRALPACAGVLLATALLLRGQEKPKLPEGPGKATTARLCGSCHAAELVMNRRESFEGWNAVVEDMLRRGMKGSDEELGEVVDYLVTHFPKTAAAAKVKVNRATAQELAKVFGISEDQAASIVKHREAQGDFKSIEDMLKVPGLDAAAVQSKKSRLEF
ncbi:MAG TPA: helix-hairpin-helix domain-containing protein [Bryobacteraceae bacterium]|nr:helix-hairpin-helix domain-containing protein [Bryobacteraceae bacterium]